MIIHFEELHKFVILPHGLIYLLTSATESLNDISVPVEENVAVLLIEETASVLLFEKIYSLSHKFTEFASSTKEHSSIHEFIEFGLPFVETVLPNKSISQILQNKSV